MFILKSSQVLNEHNKQLSSTSFIVNPSINQKAQMNSLNVNYINHLIAKTSIKCNVKRTLTIRDFLHYKWFLRLQRLYSIAVWISAVLCVRLLRFGLDWARFIISIFHISCNTGAALASMNMSWVSLVQFTFTSCSVNFGWDYRLAWMVQTASVLGDPEERKC